MTATDVSVVICSRNRAARLPGAVASVAASAEQSDLTFEIVVVDNGSTDSTPAVLADLAGRHTCVRPVVEPVAGIGRARNRGVTESRGRAVLFTDDDVRVPSGWVRALSAPILGGTADAVSGGVAMEPDLVRPWMTPAMRSRYFADVPVPPLENPGMAGASMGFRNTLLRRIRFDDQLGTKRYPGGEDVMVYVLAKELGYRIRGVRGVAVEHCFDPARLDAAILHKQAAGYGRSDAFVFHHWLHARMSAQRLRVAWHLAQRELRRAKAAPNRHDEALIELIREVAFHREMLALRDRPRRYAYRGTAVATVADESIEVGR